MVSIQPRPQGFSLKKWVGKSPGDEVGIYIVCLQLFTAFRLIQWKVAQTRILKHCMALIHSNFQKYKAMYEEKRLFLKY